MRTSMLNQLQGFTRFRRKRAAVWFDWRGSGVSDGIDGALTMGDLVADLDAVIGAVGRPVDANAWGRACFVVFLHAAQKPECYRSIRVDGGALRPGESWQGLYNRPGWEAHYSEHLQGIQRHYARSSADEAQRLALHWEKAVPASSFAAYLRAEESIDLTDVLPTIETPTWVTARLPVDYEPATELAALLPNSTLTIYEPGLERNALGDSGRDEWDRYLGAALGDPASAPVGAPYPATDADGVRLTPKEQEVLALIARGDANLEIAEALGIVEGTVKRHVSNLLQKTGLKNRRQLMRFADRRGDSG
jgi:DNA-binding CsgD family transcriptional regulator